MDMPPPINAKQQHLKQAEALLPQPNRQAEQRAWLVGSSGIDGGTNLHEAAKYGTLSLIQPGVLTEGMLAKQDEYFRTPVHHAAATGNLSALNGLLTFELLNMREANDWSPLITAAAKGHLNQLDRALLTKEALGQQHGDLLNTVHFAAMHGHLGQLAAVLDEELLTAREADGNNTPLHFAAERGDLEAVKSLLTPAMLELRNELGRSVLQSATIAGHLGQLIGVVTREQLITPDATGKTILQLAIERGQAKQLLPFLKGRVLKLADLEALRAYLQRKPRA